MNLSNLKIGTRLGLGFGVVVVLLAAVAFIAVSRISLINNATDRILSDSFLLRALSDMNLSLNSIVGQVRTSTDEITTATAEVATGTEITAASHEQEVGIEQINQAITEMDSVTQQNVALVEEAAAATAALEGQASNLTQVVGVFKLARTQGYAAPATRSAHPRVAPQLELATG